MSKKLPLVLLIVAVFILTACGSNQNVADITMKEDDAMSAAEPMTKDDGTMDAVSTDDSMGDETHSGDMIDEGESGSDDMMEETESSTDDISDIPMVETPAWFDHTFTDAATGQTFSINDLHL